MEKINCPSFFQTRPQKEKKCIYKFFNNPDEINETSVDKIPKEIIDTIVYYFTEKEFVKTFGLISKSTYNLTDSIIQANESLKNQKSDYQDWRNAEKKRLKKEEILAWEKKGKFYGNLFRPALVIVLLVNSYYIYKLSDDFKDISQGSNFTIKATVTIPLLFALIILIQDSPYYGESIGKLSAMFKNYLKEDTKPPITKFKLN